MKSVALNWEVPHSTIYSKNISSSKIMEILLQYSEYAWHYEGIFMVYGEAISTQISMNIIIIVHVFEHYSK